MKAILYDKIKEQIKDGSVISLSITTLHKGEIEVVVDTSINNSTLEMELFNELEEWVYNDLLENYLIPNDIYGDGNFDFILKEDDLCVDAQIYIDGNIAINDSKIFSNLQEETKATLQSMIESKGLSAMDVLIEFDFEDGFRKFNFESLDEKTSDYIQIPFSDVEVDLVKKLIEEDLKLLNVYSYKFPEGTMHVECEGNFLNITESWPFHVKINRED